MTGRAMAYRPSHQGTTQSCHQRQHPRSSRTLDTHTFRQTDICVLSESQPTPIKRSNIVIRPWVCYRYFLGPVEDRLWEVAPLEERLAELQVQHEMQASIDVSAAKHGG